MRTFCLLSFAMTIGLGFTAMAARQAHPKEPHQHADAAKLQNPVPADAASIEAGKKIYVDNCADCHGETGKGDGPAAPYAGDPPPSNLADAEWKHGSTDGEIFVVIRDGVSSDMLAYKEKLGEKQIWQVVNYLRSIGPKKEKK